MATKYMRALPYTLAVNSNGVINENAFILKLMYEFWGYCVNGTSALTTPGGFPSVNYVGGGLPATFLEGNPSTTSVEPSNTLTAALTFPLSASFISVTSNIGFSGSGYLLINGTEFVEYGNLSGTTGLSNSYGGTPSTTSVGSQSLPTGTFNVASTVGWPTSGNFIVSSQVVAYTNIVGNSFTGCTGGTGTITNGTTVSYYAPIGSTVTQIPLTISNTLNVVSTTGFPVFGTISVGAVGGTQNLSYTSLSGASTTANGNVNLPSGTINVGSTTGFPSAGTFTVLSTNGTQTVTYAGVTSTTFTGCTGGTGTVTNGATISTLTYFAGISGGTNLLTTTGATTTVTGTFSLPSGNISVASTNGFPTTGSFTIASTVGSQTVTYTGLSGGNTFTGCTGGTGTVTVGTSANSTASQALPNATINVLSTTGFPTFGQLIVQTSGTNSFQLVSYTGTTGYSFTGCTQLSGSGTSVAGSTITLANVPTGTTVNAQVHAVTGTDGATVTGSNVFSTQSSTPFNTSMVGKYLTMWVPNSGVSDDCVYQITAVPSSSEVIINPNNGGSPASSTLHPIFTTRTGINYRVVDAAAASQISGVAPGNFIVFQYNSSSINTGAANSQVQMFLRQSGSPPYSGTAMEQYGWIVSPSGSWTGTAFTGTPSTTVNGSQTVPSAPTTFTLNVVSTQGFPGFGVLNVGGTNVNFTGITSTSFTGCTVVTGTTFTGGTSVSMLSYNDTFTEVNPSDSSNFFGGQGATNGFVTMISDSDFFLMHVKSGNVGGLTTANAGSILHIETPYRLYPQANDPNPFTLMSDAGEGFLTQGNNGGQYVNYTGGFNMEGTDFTVRKHAVLVKCLGGDGPSSGGVSPGTTLPGAGFASSFTGFNVYNGTAVSSECTLSTFTTATQFCYTRCKLKNVRVAGPYIPAYHKIGNNGQFIHLTNGVCWPWDNTILPYNLMPGGF